MAVIKRICAAILMIVLLAGCRTEVEYVAPDVGSTYSELRGVWVSTVINLDYPSKTGLSVDELRKEAVYLLDSAAETGFNAVFLQVRPCGDAMYPSEYYPWSEYLSGEQGVAPEAGFDPLEFWADECHKRGMQLHAWINPLRVTRGGTSENTNTDVEILSADNPARENPDWVVAHKGNLYLNPGVPQVREYIVAGIREILVNYNVDGIHFDDYFYPDADFDDYAEFEEYGNGFDDLGDWRRENINDLIHQVNNLVNEIAPDVSFGVSPFAIWQNKSSSDKGSDTNGLESYSAYFADTLKWVKNEWLDYIAPQIYWNIGYEKADYAKLLSWWTDAVKDTDVALYIGHAGYRSLDANPDDVWYGSEEIERQIALNRKYDAVKGSIHFRLTMYLENPALISALKSLYLQ